MTTAIAPIHGGGFVRTAFDVLAAGWWRLEAWHWREMYCALGGEPLIRTDALPYGFDGHACAAHAFAATVRLRRAGVPMLVQRHRKGRK